MRDRQLAGFKLSRQQPIDRYYVNLLCREHKLIVEVDGSQHVESAPDQVRDARLAALGYKTIRVWNNDVLGNLDGVLGLILSELAADPLPVDGERERS